MTGLPNSGPRVALIGISGYARRHLGFLRAFESDLNLVAAVVVERDQRLEEARVLENQGVAIYSSFDSLWRKELGQLDLCIIPTGIQWHTRMTVAALDCGCNVLVEKPLAGCLKDALAIRDAERRSGNWVAVGFQDMYSAGAFRMKELLCAGRIGKLKSVRLLVLSNRGDDYYNRNHWAGCLFADGAAVTDSPLNNAFAHLVNLALFFGGDSMQESAEVDICHSELFRARNIESFDTGVVMARSTSGIDYWIGASHACAGSHTPLLEITGEEGTAIWHRGRFFKLFIDGADPIVFNLTGDDEVCKVMYSAISKKLRGGNPFICNTEIALKHIRLIDHLHRHGDIISLYSDQVERIIPEGATAESTVSSIRRIRHFLESAYASMSSLSDVGFAPLTESHGECQGELL